MKVKKLLSSFKHSHLTLNRKFSKLSVPLPISNKTLKEADPVLYDIVEKEKERQWKGLELIASENYTSQACLELNGSILTNKYSEGYPGARYYGGNQFIDQIENLCIERTLQAFRLDPKIWGANVQPLSGCPANFAVYTALMNPGDKMLGLHLYSGGHLSHGFQTETKKISATSVYFDSQHYALDPKTFLIDYDGMEKKALEFKPNIIIGGASAYSRDWDWARFRKAADSVGAKLVCDIAHTSGLIAVGELNSPFPYADVVTSTTHKSLRGSRSGIILFNKERNPGIDEKINAGVFPMLQGGPHQHQIAAVATQMREVCTPEFKEYILQVKKNAKELARAFIDKGYTILTGGTDNHLLMWDLKPQGLTGSKVEKGLDLIHITVNKNTIQGDKSAMNPGGIRIGTCALTTRGMKEKEMLQVAEFIDRFVKISLKVQDKVGKKVKDFLEGLEKDEDLRKLGDEVANFSKQFYVPGIDFERSKYCH